MSQSSRSDVLFSVEEETNGTEVKVDEDETGEGISELNKESKQQNVKVIQN